MIKLTRKVFLGVFLIAMVVVVGMGLGTLVPRPIAFSAKADDQGRPQGERRRILVLSNPIHTDIALPADPDVLKAMNFVSDAGLELDYPGVFWIVFGWGSRSFYVETPTWADLKVKPVLDALTWDRSVMHVRRAGAISPYQPDVRAIELTEQQFSVLLREIRSSFQSEHGLPPQEIPGAAYDAHDMFFPATGGFNALMGCNTWTARMLRQAGLKTGFWTPLPFTLDLSLDLHNSL
ncbi:TIGR02117 family protein [Roseibium sp. SCPC15]|uniref:TIGR02117 family protein n=1 Tax=Roseibium sp. SCP15 TaxID=3141376 RepID=UPI003336AB6C